MDTIYAVSLYEIGDCFYGTIEQFQDCFCGNEINSFEELEFHAKGILGEEVSVTIMEN